MSVTPAEFWDRVAPRYSQQPISDTESYARKLAETQALMRPDMRVLELGCGTGSTALKHAPHVSHIDATDVSATMIAIAREKAEQAGINPIDFLIVEAMIPTSFVISQNAVIDVSPPMRLLPPGGWKVKRQQDNSSKN